MLKDKHPHLYGEGADGPTLREVIGAVLSANGLHGNAAVLHDLTDSVEQFIREHPPAPLVKKAKKKKAKPVE